MARGWESKSVEEQVAEKESASAGARDPARQGHFEDAAGRREKQDLELRRERILDERTSDPRRRAALEAALADIERQLKAYR